MIAIVALLPSIVLHVRIGLVHQLKILSRRRFPTGGLVRVRVPVAALLPLVVPVLAALILVVVVVVVGLLIVRVLVLLLRARVRVVVERHERLEEAHVLEQVGEEPEPELAGGEGEEGAEEGVLQDPEGHDQAEESGGGEAEVLDAVPHRGRPQGEQAQGDQAEDDAGAANPVVPGKRT